MNYIVMDLEWNQSAKGKQFSEEHFPFEIIQIGAAKVNEQLDIVDEWQCIIKPHVYCHGHPEYNAGFLFRRRQVL